MKSIDYDMLHKSSRNAAIVTAVGALIIITSLVYSYVKLTSLTDELSRVSNKIEESKKVLFAINPILEKYGVLNKLTVDNLNSDLVKQSFEANQYIQTILSNAYNKSTKPVWYYSKDTNVDPVAVKDSLEQFGFHVIAKTAKRPDLPTNSIDFGSKVDPDEAKLLAYTLIRAGISIKAICISSLQSRANIIQIFGDDRLQNRPALTVEQIRVKNKFIFYPTPDVQKWPEDN